MRNLPLLRVLAGSFALVLAIPASAELGVDLAGEESPAAEPDRSEKPYRATDKKKAAAKKKTTVKKKATSGRRTPAAGKVTPAAGKAVPAEPALSFPEPTAPGDRTVAPLSAPAQQPVTLPTFEAGPRRKRGESAKRIAEVNKVYQRGEYESAALAYDAILRDASYSDLHEEARYQQAKSLAKLGLNHSAISRLEPILAKGSHAKYYYNALEWLFNIGSKLSNESVVVTHVARYAGGAMPPSAQDNFNYLLARYSYDRGRGLDELGQTAEARRMYQDARRLATLVRSSAGARPSVARAPQTGDEEALQGDVYAKSRFLLGLIQYAEGENQAAVESFKEAVRLTHPKRGRSPDPRLRDLAFLQLARIHYEHKQNRYAIFYYDRMRWGGDGWLEGLWESSYAHYRVGNYEKALGNLLTLQSPYFREEWFPESWILKAIIYYENCRYPEARSILDDFRTIYEPVYTELERMTSRQSDPATFYEVIGDAARRKGDGERVITRRIMNVAFMDRSVKRLNDSIVEIENEMDRGISGRQEGFRSSALAKELKDQLQRERRRMIEEAGGRARAKLEFERDGMRELLQQALRIKIEVSRKEREALEGALSRGGQVEVLKNYKFSTAVSDEHLYWPYDGEFWRDELGTYTYTLTKGCRDTSASAAR